MAPVQGLKSMAPSSKETRRSACYGTWAQVKYTYRVDHQSLIGLHEHSCTQPINARTPAFCIFFFNQSLLFEGAIGQPK
jgi:hypothetical protein